MSSAKREGSPDAAPAKRMKTAHFSTDLYPARGRLADYIVAAEHALLEKDVGIKCYVDSSVPPIAGILKHRFLDFLVNEVCKDGAVVHLGDTSRPEPPAPVEKQEEAPTAPPTPAEEWPVDADARLESLLASEKIVELRAFLAKGPPLPSNRPKGRQSAPVEGASVLSNPIESKEARTNLHKGIREIFGGLFLTEATTVADQPVVSIIWAANNKHRDRGVKRQSTSSPYKYMHFHLQKTNRETHDVLGAIAALLHVHSRDLGVTGTKDKRSVSVQRVALRRGDRTLEDVWKLIKFGPSRGGSRGGGRGGRGGRGGDRDQQDHRARMRGISVGDFAYRPDGLELGDLGGNRFGIVLRDVKTEGNDTIERAMATLRDKGFINYFGMQRFGSSAIGTHVVGLAVLQGNFALAADLCLRPRLTDTPDVAEARRLWSATRDAKAALKVMPRGCVAERALLEAYAKNPDVSHSVAFNSIPKNLRMMYIHAYQSRLWNTVVSERIRRSGCTAPTLGDLVLATPVEDEAEDLEALSAEPSVKSVEDTDGDDEAATIEQLRKLSKLPDVKVITSEAELASYTIFDVVLPLAGFLITYPDGELGQIYRETMLADGIDPDHLYRNQREYSMGGVYRKIMHRPRDVTHAVLHYDDPDFELAQSDVDRLAGRNMPLPPATGRYTALRLEFTLSASTYATMALREVLKSDTATASQRALTVSMNEEHARVKEEREEVAAAATKEGGAGDAAA